MKGRPHFLLCPQCRRLARHERLDSEGYYSARRRASEGITRTGREKKGQGRFRNLPRHEVVHARCGHRWFTTHYNRS